MNSMRLNGNSYTVSAFARRHQSHYFLPIILIKDTATERGVGKYVTLSPPRNRKTIKCSEVALNKGGVLSQIHTTTISLLETHHLTFGPALIYNSHQKGWLVSKAPIFFPNIW